MRCSPVSFGLVALGLILATAGAASAQQTSGARVFAENCAICHSLQPGMSGTGPTLFDIYGRKAATRPFNYSDALKAAGAGGLTWTDENITKWVTKPEELVPGNLMGFAGIPYPEDAPLLIKFLKSGGEDPGLPGE